MSKKVKNRYLLPITSPSRSLHLTRHMQGTWKVFVTNLMKVGADHPYGRTSRRLRGPLCGHIPSLEVWKKPGPTLKTAGTWRRLWQAMRRRRLCAWERARRPSRRIRFSCLSLEISRLTGDVPFHRLPFSVCSVDSTTLSARIIPTQVPLRRLCSWHSFLLGP